MTGMSVAEGLAIGLLVTVVAPLVAKTFSSRPRRWSAGSLAIPVVVVLAAHFAVIVSADEFPARSSSGLLLRVGLLVCSVFFWMPVFGPGRISDAARCVYLFLASPVLDLPALYLIAMGHSDPGIAMVTGMLPLPLTAVGFFYAWMRDEERSHFSPTALVEEEGGGHEPKGPFRISDPGYIAPADQPPCSSGADRS